jgi:hypothetical protein
MIVCIWQTEGQVILNPSYFFDTGYYAKIYGCLDAEPIKGLRVLDVKLLRFILAKILSTLLINMSVCYDFLQKSMNTLY